MKTANDIFTWIFQSGAIVWLFYFGFVIAKPWVDGKIKHAKTAQQREAWALLEQVAMTTVNSLVSSGKSGSQKFAEASTLVASYLSDHGIKVDMKTIQAAVQAAYEKSPLTTPPTQSTVHVSANGITTTVGPVAKHITNIDANHINAGKLKPAHVDPADMPGAQKTPAKPKMPTNVIAKKGIPVDKIKDVAVQTPQPEPQGDDADANKD